MLKAFPFTLCLPQNNFGGAWVAMGWLPTAHTPRMFIIFELSMRCLALGGALHHPMFRRECTSRFSWIPSGIEATQADIFSRLYVFAASTSASAVVIYRPDGPPYHPV